MPSRHIRFRELGLEILDNLAFLLFQTSGHILDSSDL
jgi:hypothetical protein